jgi:NAD(P)-dependent dehydrogenase (short-subunit alcohol dehydrogenase family)
VQINLSDRTALVTGSTAGIGKAVAAGLAAAGADVTVNGRGQEGVDETVDWLSRMNGDGRVQGIAADISTAEGCASLTRALPDVDILVNNAGIFEATPVFDISDDDWLRLFTTNVLSGIRLARAYVPSMVARGWGRVVFVSSESALHIPTEMVHYGMTKTAQLAVARGMAESVAGSGVTVNSVLPGPTLTEGVEVFLRGLAADADGPMDDIGRDFIAAERPTSVIQRLASPEEVANLIVYTVSPQASATTGAALRVDGGVVRAIP